MGSTFNRIKTWTAEILRSSDLNSEFDNILTNFTPSGMDDASGSSALMQAVTDPYPGGTPSLSTDLLGEIKRIRYLLAQITGESYWYIDPDTNLAACASAYAVGVCLDYLGTTAPTGWLLLDGKTIGDGSSSATSRANADTVSLYTLLWDGTSNTDLVIQDSGGNPTTRGASASADFAAHKRMPLPDFRGRCSIGKDNMGGSSANIVTDSNADALAGVMGTETHSHTTGDVTLSATQSGQPGFSINVKATTVHDEMDGGGVSGGYIYSAGDGAGASSAYAVAAAAAAAAHNHGTTQTISNMTPCVAINKIVKYA